MRWLKFNVAAFLAVGVGYSVAFFLFDALAPSSGLGGEMFSGFVAVMAFFVGLLLAPLIAAVTSLRIASEFRGERNVVLANSFVGSAVGFLVMFFVLFLFVWSTVGGGGGGGGGGGLGDFLGPIVGFTVGVGLTGALTAYVTREL
jgi:sterol desaturase/sphingolipid hydroxylase (fatty acid hydroxylase superfamily)